MVNHDRPTGGQRDDTGIGAFNLMFNLEAGEEGNGIPVTFDPVDHVRHDIAHELSGLFIDFIGINQDFADIRLEIIPDGTDDQ